MVQFFNFAKEIYPEIEVIFLFLDTNDVLSTSAVLENVSQFHTKILKKT